MTKVLMLITSLAGGGAERVPSELSLNLSNDISRRIVILKSRVVYPSDQEPISMGFDFKTSNLYTLLHMLIIGTIKYHRLIKKNKPDVSMSFLVLDNFVNLLSNIGNKNTKVIVSVHAALSKKFDNSLPNKIIKLLIACVYNRSDLIVTVSDGVRDELINDFKLTPSKIKTIHNPINIEKIEKLCKIDVDEKLFDDNIPIIITVGRLTEQKGQWHLIRAFSYVNIKMKCKLCIIGVGNLEPKLKKLVDDLQLNNNVIFLGWRDNPFKYISRSSVFVLSSLTEALPYALIEAMACGCPVIATDCEYGPKEILNDGEFGVLVPVMDGVFRDSSKSLTNEEVILGNEILRLLNSDKCLKFYSQKSKERSQMFNKSLIINIYEKEIKSLLET